MLKKLSSYFIVLMVGTIIGTYFDAKHTIEEEVITKDRVRTVIKEVITERPNGTKITERYTDKKEKKNQVAKKKESKPSSKNWGVSIKTSLFEPTPQYTVEVHRRIFSTVYVSAYGRSDSTVGVGVSFFF